MNYSIKNKTDKWIFSALSLVESDTLTSIFWQITAAANDRINFTASLGTKQNYSGKNKILIDDRPDNIEQWRSKGGIGILHTSAQDTIKQLQNLGL
jgi:hypothetical protein